MKKIIIPLAMLGAGFAVLSLAMPKFSRTPSAVDVATSSRAAAKPGDLTGEWELDPSRSDIPWMRGGGGANGGPRPGRDGADGFRGGAGPNGPRGQGGPGRMRLPQHFQ